MSLDAGVTVNHQAIETYTKFKMNKVHDFVIFRISDNLNEIIVDVSPASGESEQVFQEMGARCSVPRERDEPAIYWNLRRLLLEKKEPRYGTVMVSGKLVLIVWSPDDTADTKKKMLYSSTKNSFKSKLEGVQIMLQCNDLDELSYSDVLKSAVKA